MAKRKRKFLNLGIIDHKAEVALEQAVELAETANKNSKKISYRDKQTLLYSKFYRNLRTGVAVKICNMGDSLTYGQDGSSADKRIPDATVLPDGSNHVQYRASVTYPEALQEYMNQIYGAGKVNVINRGYSGDGTKAAFNRWITSSGADLTTINFGVNDSRATWVDYRGDLSVYLDYYRKLIERELDWGSALIILTPPKMRKANDMNIDTFANALTYLASEYGIPVIDTEEFMENYGADCYADGTHLNGKGYRIFGAKLASIFVGRGAHKPKRVSNGSTVLTRPTLDNVTMLTGSSFGNNAAFPTPAEEVAGQGIGATLAADGAMVYSFYTENNNTVAVPMMFADNTSITYELTLDFGVEQPDYSFDLSMGYTAANFTDKPSSIINIARPQFPSGNGHYNSTTLTKLSEPYLLIVGKGWHTLKIKAKKTAGNSIVYGVDFFGYDSFKAKLYNNSIKPVEYSFKTHNLFSDTTDVSSSIVNMETALRAIGQFPSDNDYWKYTPLKVTVFNWDENILEYVLQPGGLTGSGNKWILSPDFKEYKIKATPTVANIRTLSSISYNTTTKELTLTWAGATTRATNVIIKSI